MKGRASRVVLRIAIVLVLTAGGLEIGSRILDRFRGEPFDPEALRAEIQVHVEAVRPRALIHGGHQDETRAAAAPRTEILSPYTAWEQLVTQGQIAEDAEYYRRSEAADVYDVCVLGGSVAHGFATMGAAPLLEHLKSDPRFEGREIRIHNYAMGGFKQLQQVMLLAYLLDWGQQPDAVIELDGFNEAAIGEGNARMGVHPAYPAPSSWASAAYGRRMEPELVLLLHDLRAKQDRATAFGERLLSCGLWRSAFLGRAGVARLVTLRRAYIDQFFVYQDHVANRPKELGSHARLSGPRFAGDPDGISDAIVTAWEESSISMEAMCSARGIVYLHVLQPALHDPGSKPLTKKEIESGEAGRAWIEGVVRTYPRLREAGRRLSARGIAFLDATGVFADHEEDVYYDACHFKEHGNAILAASVAKALLAAVPR